MALPTSARRVRALPSSPTFTESCSLVALVELILLFSAMRSMAFERITIYRLTPNSKMASAAAPSAGISP